MAKTEVYTCDICKKSTNQKDLSELRVKAAGIHFTENNLYYASELRIDVCVDCLKEKGFAIEQQNNKFEDRRKKENEKILENKILDILLDLGVAFTE